LAEEAQQLDLTSLQGLQRLPLVLLKPLPLALEGQVVLQSLSIPQTETPETLEGLVSSII
jgi:hypothetical protein